MKIHFSVLTFSLVISLFAPLRAQVPVSQDSLRAHIAFLADDVLAGREPTTLGSIIAGEYIRARLLTYGLSPLFDSGFHYFSLGERWSIDTSAYFVANGQKARIGFEYYPAGISGDGRVAAGVVFCGKGRTSSPRDKAGNDYLRNDPSGKWALLIDENTGSGLSAFVPPVDKDLSRAQLASRKGAAGLIIVSPMEGCMGREQMVLQYFPQRNTAPIPVMHVSNQLAASWFAASGYDFEAIRSKILKGKKTPRLKLNVLVEAKVNIDQTESSGRNVVAFLPGTDPTCNQYFVVGAHYDHVGMGGFGSRYSGEPAVHNGADDNASGTASVIELARLLSASEKPLRHGVYFCAFDAEEMGLIGSARLAKRFKADSVNFLAMINLDMIGRLNEENRLTIMGTGTSEVFDTLLSTLNEPYNFDLALSPEGYGGSDHTSFAQIGVPVLFFHTGLHNEYHTPSDDIELINFEGQANVTAYVADVIYALDTLSRPLKYEMVKKTEADMPAVRLGIVPDVSGAVENGLLVRGVNPGGIAETGGIRENDIIRKINAIDVNNIFDYMTALGTVSPGETIHVTVERNEQVLEFDIEIPNE